MGCNDPHFGDIRPILIDMSALKQRQDGFGDTLTRIDELIRNNDRNCLRSTT